MQAVNVALGLGAGCPQFKPNLARFHAFMQLLEVFTPNVLQRVLQAGEKIGHKLCDRSAKKRSVSESYTSSPFSRFGGWGEGRRRRPFDAMTHPRSTTEPDTPCATSRRSDSEK